MPILLDHQGWVPSTNSSQHSEAGISTWGQECFWCLASVIGFFREGFESSEVSLNIDKWIQNSRTKCTKHLGNKTFLLKSLGELARGNQSLLNLKILLRDNQLCLHQKKRGGAHCPLFSLTFTLLTQKEKEGDKRRSNFSLKHLIL